MGYVAADYTSWVAGARCVGGARPSLGASFGAGVHHGAALRFGRRAALPFGAAYGGAASTPCAVGMGVGTITDAGGGPWSRGRPLGAAAGPGRGAPTSVRIAVRAII